MNDAARERIAEIDPEMLLADGFEAAIIGVASRCGMRTVVVYDRAKCISILVERDGMDHEEAEEFFEFNVAGAYMGEYTPMYLERLSDDDEVE